MPTQFLGRYRRYFGAPLGQNFKILGLFWGNLQPMADHEKQRLMSYNHMIINGFRLSRMACFGLKYWGGDNQSKKVMSVRLVPAVHDLLFEKKI